MGEAPLQPTTYDRIGDVDADDWDVGLGAASAIGAPFQGHRFLRALEDSGCAAAATGWIPRHLTLRAEGRLVAGCTGYIKTHSHGEFVDDWAWSDQAARSETPYYPKLVIATPFTPVTGTRLHAAAGLDARGQDRARRALLLAVIEQARAANLAGVHLLSCTAEEAALAEDLGFAWRLGCRYRWENAGYRDFADFLARFSSKRRNQIRRERRAVRDAGITTESVSGAALGDELLAPMVRFYNATIDRYPWGRRYLHRALFSRWWDTLRPALQLTLARRDGVLIGGALNFWKDDRRFGRYWGADQDWHALHFEVCAYSAIEGAIADGVATFDAGAGGFPHKYRRGFVPTPSHSAHLIFAPRMQATIRATCTHDRRRDAQRIADLRAQAFAR